MTWQLPDGPEHWWMDLGACATEEPEVFLAPGRVTEALAACRRCPVTATCAAYAEENGEHLGVWGGRLLG